MNREVTTGNGSIYPLLGDIASKAGVSTVSVTGIQGIPVQQTFPTGGEVLTYDVTVNNLILEAPIQQIELETNGTANSTQSLLNLAAGTNVTITESAGTITIDAASGGGITRGALNTNANGNWYVWSDGIIESWGSISISPTTTAKATGTITFPLAYTTAVTGIDVSIVGTPRVASTDLADVLMSSLSLSSAGVDLQCSIPVGGGGATFDQTVQVYWRAIGK